MYAHLEEPTSHVPISVTTSDIALEPDDSHLHSKASGNGIRHRILSLSPSLFLTTMGTGILPILIIQLPYQAVGFFNISVVFLILNIMVFLVLCVLSIVRYTIWPGVVYFTVRHPVESLYLGTIPTGIATIVTMLSHISNPVPEGFLYLMQTIFWMTVVLSLLSCLGIPLLMIMEQEHSIDKMTAIWLLPIIPPIVTASTGANLCAVIPPDSAAFSSILVASYILWGIGVPMVMTILVLYVHRLVVYKLPPLEVSVSTLLPIGPLGQGGAAIIKLGVMAKNVDFISPEFAVILHGVGIFVGLMMWAYAVVWIAFALVTIAIRVPRITFSIGWWGLTYPLGTFSLCSIYLGRETALPFFDILGTGVTICVILLWFLVSTKTAIAIWKGDLYNGMCTMHKSQEYSRMQVDSAHTEMGI